MNKEDLKNPIVWILSIMFFFTILLFGYFYFIKPIKVENKKYEIDSISKEELILLTSAYLNQNPNISIENNILNENYMTNNKYQTTAEYLYLKNKDFNFDDLETIKRTAKLIFGNSNISITNFEINLDDEHCGKKKYSTIEGYIVHDNCDSSLGLYEVKDVYKSEEDYIVEVYAATAKKEKNDATNTCNSFEKKYAYTVSLTDYSGEEFYKENYEKCRDFDGVEEDLGVYKKELINQTKLNDKLYKFYYKKVDNNFVYYKIEK